MSEVCQHGNRYLPEARTGKLFTICGCTLWPTDDEFKEIAKELGREAARRTADNPLVSNAGRVTCGGKSATRGGGASAGPGGPGTPTARIAPRVGVEGAQISVSIIAKLSQVVTCEGCTVDQARENPFKYAVDVQDGELIDWEVQSVKVDK